MYIYVPKMKSLNYVYDYNYALLNIIAHFHFISYKSVHSIQFRF